MQPPPASVSRTFSRSSMAAVPVSPPSPHPLPGLDLTPLGASPGGSHRTRPPEPGLLHETQCPRVHTRAAGSPSFRLDLILWCGRTAFCWSVTRPWTLGRVHLGARPSGPPEPPLDCRRGGSGAWSRSPSVVSRCPPCRWAREPSPGRGQEPVSGTRSARFSDEAGGARSPPSPGEEGFGLQGGVSSSLAPGRSGVSIQE